MDNFDGQICVGCGCDLTADDEPIISNHVDNEWMCGECYDATLDFIAAREHTHWLTFGLDFSQEKTNATFND